MALFPAARMTTMMVVVMVMVMVMEGVGRVEGGGVEVVDLTHTLGADSPFWPGSPPFQFNQMVRGNQSVGFWYEANSFFTPEHGGTHVDAPAHFYRGKWRTERIPASHLVGPAVLIDVKVKAAADPDYLVTVEDLQNWEKAHGKIPEKAMVLMNSGWSARYPNKTLVFNTPTPDNASTLHFPGFHPDAARFLATQRSVIAVGVDTPSIDHGPSTTFSTHVVLGKHNIIGLENVANLDQLPPRGATVVAGVVKLLDGSGGPARILALVGEGADIFGSATSGGSSGRGGGGGFSRCVGVVGLQVLWVSWAMVVVMVGSGWV